MKKYVLLITIIFSTFNNLLAKEATSEDLLPLITDKENWVSCENLYLQHLKNQTSKVQNNSFDIWWAINDKNYVDTVADEFKLKELMPKKRGEYDALLKNNDVGVSINACLKFDKYDFDKKGFPITFFVGKANELTNGFCSIQSSLTKTILSFTKNSCWLLAADKFDKKLPDEIFIKFANKNEMSFFLPIPENEAKEYTANFGNNDYTPRGVEAIIRVKLGRTRLVKEKQDSTLKKYFKFIPKTFLEIDFNVNEIEIGKGDKTLIFKN